MITVTWKNGRKHVHNSMHGRQPHIQFAQKAGSPRASLDHTCKRVCMLNEDEAEQADVFGQNFPCNNANHPHRHYTRATIDQLVDRGEARWVGKGKNVAAFVTSKTWQPKMSGGMNVMQMVPGGLAC